MIIVIHRTCHTKWLLLVLIGTNVVLLVTSSFIVGIQPPPLKLPTCSFWTPPFVRRAAPYGRTSSTGHSLSYYQDGQLHKQLSSFATTTTSRMMGIYEQIGSISPEKYVIRRNVTLLSYPNDCQILPSQIYQCGRCGGAVVDETHALKTIHTRNKNSYDYGDYCREFAETTFALSYRLSSTTSEKRNVNDNEDDNQPFSKKPVVISASSQFLLDQYSLLTNEQQQQLPRKIIAETQAAQPLDPNIHLKILYYDEHICVTYKPGGVLSVPGPRRNPSLANLVHTVMVQMNKGGTIHTSSSKLFPVDTMVVHRLDFDTSGVLVFALSELALKRLHDDFRFRRVRKSYEALLCGHIPTMEVEIDIALERDPYHPPFMRIAQDRFESSSTGTMAATTNKIVHPSFAKLMDRAPKPCLTELRVLSFGYLQGQRDELLPVTRVELTPHSGRTHQLRVHSASLGYPIVGDSIYGYNGEGNCGVDSDYLDVITQGRSQIQRQINELGVPLCLHAKSLSLYHPFTGAPMVFECQAPF